MATHKSAIKRDRQNKAQRLRNMAYRTRAKKAIKGVRLTITNKKVEDATLSLNNAISVLQKGQSKGAIHQNTASRKISRLARQVNKMGSLASSEENKDGKPDPPKQDRPSSQS